MKQIEAPTVVVQVRGGVVCQVHSNSPDVQVIVTDWDDIREQDDAEPHYADVLIARHQVELHDAAIDDGTKTEAELARAREALKKLST